MKAQALPVFLLASALGGTVGCDPENTKRYACVESDCQVVCQAKGRPEGEDEDHPFGRCVDGVCQCEAVDTDPLEWSDPEERRTLGSDEETGSDSASDDTSYALF